MDLADLANLTSGISSAVPQTLNLGLAFRRALMDEELHKQGLADKRFTRGLQAVELAGKYPEYADLLPTIAGETGQAPMGGMNLPTPEAPTVAPPTATAIPTEPPAGRAPEPIETPTTPGLAGPTMAMPGTPPPAPPEPVTGLPPTPAAGTSGLGLLAARAKQAQKVAGDVAQFEMTRDLDAFHKAATTDPVTYARVLARNANAQKLYTELNQERADTRDLAALNQAAAAKRAARPDLSQQQALYEAALESPNAARLTKLVKERNLTPGIMSEKDQAIRQDAQKAGQILQQVTAGQMTVDQAGPLLVQLDPSVQAAAERYPVLATAIAQARGAGTERGKVLAGEESVPGVPGQKIGDLRADQARREAQARALPHITTNLETDAQGNVVQIVSQTDPVTGRTTTKQIPQGKIGKPLEWAAVGTVPGVGGATTVDQVPEQIRPVVQSILNYKYPVPTGGFAMRDPQWKQILSYVMAIDPSFDATQYKRRQNAATEFSTGRQSRNIVALNTAIDHLANLQKSAAALGNAGAQFWNAVANYGITKLGDPRVTNFQSDARAVESEVASVFKGTGATDQEIKAWRENLSSSMSPAQLRGSMDELLKLMNGRLQALRDQYEKSMGKPADFHFLSPKSRAILQSMGQGDWEADATSAPSSGVTIPPDAAGAFGRGKK